MSQSSPARRIQENLEELFQAQKASGDAYIKFQLTAEIQALLPMKQVKESSIVKAEQITPIPGMPESTIGMMNSRDRVFCVFDLAQLLNLSAQLIVPRQYQIIMVQTSTEPQIQIGLVVQKLQGIIRLNPERIQSFYNSVHPNLIPYISGVAIENDIPLAILNFEQVLASIHNISTVYK